MGFNSHINGSSRGGSRIRGRLIWADCSKYLFIKVKRKPGRAEGFFPSVIPPHGHYHNTISDTKQNVNESMMSRLEQLRAQFGDSNVNGALVNSLMSGFGATLKDFIRNSAMPGFMKEAAINEVNRFLAENRQPTTADAQAGVHECGAGELASNAGSAIAEGANAEAEGASGTQAPGSAPAGGKAGSGGVDIVDNAIESIQQQTNENQKPDEAKGDGKSGVSGGGKNWLVALAEKLAEVQHTFLDNAMKNMDIMVENADFAQAENAGAEKVSSGNQAGGDNKSAEGGVGGDTGDKAEFLKAQSQYQANIQMFNMMANMTSTSLKSLGEGLTAIARKQ